MKVGFIGLGAMGLPMTRNLLAKGHEVTVSSRSRGPIDAALEAGASDGGDAAGVAAASEVTILCVPRDGDVQQVIGELLPVLGPGKIVVDASTISPEVERAQHERVNATGAGYLEAPVSGGTVGAEQGTLTLMVGGDAEVLEAARPALEAFSALIVHVGGPGSGQVVKLGNNLIYAAQMLAVSEAFAMLAKSGVDLEKAHEIYTHATADCFAVRTRVPFEGVIKGGVPDTGWKPGFMTELMAKDLDLALACAAAAGVPLYTTSLVRQITTTAVEDGSGREDFSAIGKVIRRISGV
jgi:3-hydroxyisobutyrate dehydrogenase